MRSEIQGQPRQIANQAQCRARKARNATKLNSSSLLNTNPNSLSESNGYSNIIRLARLLRVLSPRERVLHAYFLHMH